MPDPADLDALGRHTPVLVAAGVAGRPLEGQGTNDGGLVVPVQLGGGSGQVRLVHGLGEGPGAGGTLQLDVVGLIRLERIVGVKPVGV